MLPLDDATLTEILTPNELQAVRLHELGHGYRRIATTLGVATTTIRDRIDRAAQKIARHLDQITTDVAEPNE